MASTDNEPLEIIKTGDGSCTLLNKTLNETYHSVNGAITESRHVFITNGLLKYNSLKEEIHILEVGLGTGLNALLTIENVPPGKTVYYTAIEPYPLTPEMAIEYFNQYDIKPKRLDLLPQIMQNCNGAFIKLDNHFYFSCYTQPLQTLTQTDLIGFYSKLKKDFTAFDIIYYDAFAPQKQPDMWTLETLQMVVNLLDNNGLITSYCAQGQFKRHLKSLHLKVETVPGPPGKREMTIATW